MKITLEPAAVPETEVIIRGDIASEEVSSILQALNKKASGKLMVCKDDEQFILNVEEIVYLETTDSKIAVYTDREVYECRQKLYELSGQLESFRFVQINKSTLVNLDHIRSIQAEFSGNYRVKLKSRSDILTISRKYFKAFRNRI